MCLASVSNVALQSKTAYRMVYTRNSQWKGARSYLFLKTRSMTKALNSACDSWPAFHVRALDFGQANRWRRVGSLNQRTTAITRAIAAGTKKQSRQSGANRLPLTRNPQSRTIQDAANVVGPNSRWRNFGGELFGREPVGHQPRARGKPMPWTSHSPSRSDPTRRRRC